MTRLFKDCFGAIVDLSGETTSDMQGPADGPSDAKMNPARIFQSHRVLDQFGRRLGFECLRDATPAVFHRPNGNLQDGGNPLVGLAFA